MRFHLDRYHIIVGFTSTCTYVVAVVAYIIYYRSYHDRFTLTYFISLYHQNPFMSSNSVQDRVYSIPWYAQYMIKFFSDLRQAGFLFLETLVSFTNKTIEHDITKIVLKSDISFIFVKPSYS